MKIRQREIQPKKEIKMRAGVSGRGIATDQIVPNSGLATLADM
jgi:hypothetical protein